MLSRAVYAREYAASIGQCMADAPSSERESVLLQLVGSGAKLLHYYYTTLLLPEADAQLVESVAQPSWRSGPPLCSPARSRGRLKASRSASESALNLPQHGSFRTFNLPENNDIRAFNHPQNDDFCAF